MLEGKLMRVCDFEWASVCQYMIYLSAMAELKEINFSGVTSFPYVTVGGEGLKSRKQRTLRLLEFNRTRLEVFVAERKDSIEDVELAVIRGMYRQLVESEKTVQGHLGTIERLMVRECQAMDLGREGENKDELPF
jgi:hypothetical protein